MTGWLIALAIAAVGLPLYLRLHKKYTVAKHENEVLLKQLERFRKMEEISSRAPATPSDILDRMRNGKL
jgi:hypothetical protein